MTQRSKAVKATRKHFFIFKNKSHGVTLIEVVIATCILTILALTLGMIVQRFGHGQRDADLRRVAAGLAHDAIETLRLQPFGYLYTTADADAPGDGCLASASAYDKNPRQFPPETIPWGSFSFRRTYCIEAVTPKEDQLERIDAELSNGLKRVVVRVAWPAERPEQDYELQSVIQDPKISASTVQSASLVQSMVQCSDGTQSPEPCPGIPFFVSDASGVIVSRGVSDEEGKFTLHHLPMGNLNVKPVLLADETTDPPDAAVVVQTWSSELNIPAFVLTRSAAWLHIKTNRIGTLVTATEGLPPDQPPPIALDREDPAHVFAMLVDEQAQMRVTPGTYSIRCWWESPTAGNVAIDPPGGINRILDPGSVTDLSCEFEK